MCRFTIRFRHLKITREAPYHELTNGGHIGYIELDGDPTQNLEAFEAVVRAMKEAGISYGAIQPSSRPPIRSAAIPALSVKYVRAAAP